MDLRSSDIPHAGFPNGRKGEGFERPLPLLLMLAVLPIAQVGGEHQCSSLLKRGHLAHLALRCDRIEPASN